MTLKEYAQACAYQYEKLYEADVIRYMIFEISFYTKQECKTTLSVEDPMYKVFNYDYPCNDIEEFINKFDDDLKINISDNMILKITSWTFAHETSINDVRNEDRTISKNVILPSTGIDEIRNEINDNRYSIKYSMEEYKDITKEEFMVTVENTIKEYIDEYKRKYVINDEEDYYDDDYDDDLFKVFKDDEDEENNA